MPIDPSIARGIRPIGADLPDIAQMLFQRQQAQQQNALREQAAGIDQQNADTLRQNYELGRQRTAQNDAAQAEQSKFEQRKGQLGAAIQYMANNPASEPYVLKQFGHGSRDDFMGEAISMGVVPPQAPGPIQSQRVGGATVLMQDGKPVGAPRWDERPAPPSQTSPPGAAQTGRFGAPRVGINPQTGTAEYFQADQLGNVRWIGSQSATGAEAEARASGKTVAGAKADAPRIQDNANDMLDVLRQLKDSNLGLVYGWSSLVPTIPNTAQADAVALWEQVQGKAFLEAFNVLKGGGQITEKEGEKATAAITRLSQRRMSPGAAKAAISELESIVQRGAMRAEQRAGIRGPAGYAVAPPQSPEQAAPQTSNDAVDYEFVPGKGLVRANR